MLLILEKLYVALRVPVEEDRRGNIIRWPKKVEIPITEVSKWMHSTGRNYPHGWRIKDYLQWAYKGYDITEYGDSEEIEYLFVDYVFKVPEGVPGASDVQHVLYRHTSNRSDSCAVQLNDGNIFVARIESLSKQCNSANVGLIFSELITDKNDWFGAAAERCSEGHWGQQTEDNPHELFFNNICDEIPHFAEAYYFDQNYDKMVLAMAYEAAWRMKDMSRFHDMYNEEDFDSVFSNIYYTDGKDMGDWQQYAVENDLDPDDDDEREAYEEDCDEFAMARYKIDYDCKSNVQLATCNILEECFYPLYEF